MAWYKTEYPAYFSGRFLEKHALSTPFPTSLSLVFAHTLIFTQTHTHRAPENPPFLLQRWVENKIVPNWLHMWESVLWVDAHTAVPPFYPHPSLPLPLPPLSLSLIPYSWFVVEGRPPVSGVPWRPFSSGLEGDPSNGGRDSVCMCEMCPMCGKVCMCVWEAHTGEVTKGMMESCQSREVQRRGKVIRGRGKRLEKSWVYQTAFGYGCTSVGLVCIESDCFHAQLGLAESKRAICSSCAWGNTCFRFLPSSHTVPSI